MRQKGLRGLRGDPFLVAQAVDLARIRRNAKQSVARAGVRVRAGERDDRVDEHKKIRSRFFLFDRVRVSGPAGIKMGADCRCQVPAGGKAHDADASRVDTVRCGKIPDRPHGAFRVIHLYGMAIRAVPIPQDKSTHAEGVEPFCLIDPLIVHHCRQAGIPAARTDDDRRAITQTVGRRVQIKHGFVRIAVSERAGRARGRAPVPEPARRR